MPKTRKQDRAKAMKHLREIANEMHTIVGRMRRPRIVWAWDCPTRTKWKLRDEIEEWHLGAYTNRAHTHVEARNKGIICISPSWLLGNREVRWTAPHKWPYLIAHEMIHIRFPKVRHGTPTFEMQVRWLTSRYEEERSRRAIRLVLEMASERE